MVDGRRFNLISEAVAKAMNVLNPTVTNINVDGVTVRTGDDKLHIVQHNVTVEVAGFLTDAVGKTIQDAIGVTRGSLVEVEIKLKFGAHL